MVALAVAATSLWSPPASAAVVPVVLLSASPDRTGAVPLQGAQLVSPAYVFVETGDRVQSVSFYVDDTDAVSAPRQVERDPAYDLAGTAPDGRAKPLPADALPAGTHTLTVVAVDGGGRRTTTSATFRTGTAPVSPPPASPPPPVPTPPPPAPARGLLFGMGPQSTGAARTALAAQAPVGMLTSWYNGPGDLDWMTRYLPASVPGAYAEGKAMHLVVYSGDEEGGVSTSRGQACGRRYPLSDRFLGDMQRIARTFAGRADGPPLYVTMFTEFQTYPCQDNTWGASAETTRYYEALKDRYRQAVDLFHAEAPNAQVSLGWGGWQLRWDDPVLGGGRSLLPHFADVMRASDFQSFQAMHSDSNVADVRGMTAELGRYGRVMLAHYKPDNGSQATFDADVRALLTDDSVRRLQDAGLFAFSFMDDANLSRSADTFAFVRDAVRRYAP